MEDPEVLSLEDCFNDCLYPFENDTAKEQQWFTIIKEDAILFVILSIFLCICVTHFSQYYDDIDIRIVYNPSHEQLDELPKQLHLLDTIILFVNVSKSLMDRFRYSKLFIYVKLYQHMEESELVFNNQCILNGRTCSYICNGRASVRLSLRSMSKILCHQQHPSMMKFRIELHHGLIPDEVINSPVKSSIHSSFSHPLLIKESNLFSIIRA